MRPSVNYFFTYPRRCLKPGLKPKAMKVDKVANMKVDMEVYKVADMEVDLVFCKVADMEVKRMADMEVNRMADMEVFKMVDMVADMDFKIN